MKKLVCIGIPILLIFVFLGHSFARLIDWEKHEQWKKKRLQAILDVVDEEGSSKYIGIVVGRYDENGDDIIDVKEAEVIREYVE